MKLSNLPVTAKDLRALPADKVQEILTALGTDKADELKYTWPFWARPDQIEPEGRYKIWMPLAGRGWGKTRTGAETVREWAKQGLKRIACVAPTKGDVRRVMVEGESGLLNVCWDKDKTHRGVHMGRPIWSPTNNTITWENGAKAEFFSAEDPERLRGPQFHAAWCFTKGHKVTMSDLTIKDVSEVDVNDYVLTSNGPNIVEKTMQRSMPVGCVTLSDGTSLEGTYDHPIFTQRGFVSLGELKESDFCITMGFTGLSTHKGTTTPLVSEPCIGMLEKSTSVTYPALTSITSTETSLTTTQATYSHSQGQNILNSTMENSVDLNQESHLVQESSVVTTAGSKCLGSQNLGTEFRVKLAQTEEQMRSARPQKPASTVGQVSEVSKEPYAVSVVSTWLPTGVKTVYNLQVENTHEYFVNGILTHNCDETAAWRNVQEVWDMLQFTLRLGNNPKILMTTTPKPIKLIRRIVDLSREEPEKYVVTTGSSYDNSDNIDLEALKAYEGTRLGRQELYAEILEESAGALWTMKLLDEAQIHKEDVPLIDPELGYKEDNLNLSRIVVAIDPAITSNEESDMTGIMVAGIDVNGQAYVLEDATDRYKPAEWAQKAIDLLYRYKADRIVAERNQGGEMVRHTLQTEDASVPIRLVHASRGKYARAEPVSALYEQGRVKHLPGLDDVERQMTIWEPLGKMGSPDRLDALVWALTDLMLGGVARPQLSLSYKNEKEASI